MRCEVGRSVEFWLCFSLSMVLDTEKFLKVSGLGCEWLLATDGGSECHVDDDTSHARLGLRNVPYCKTTCDVLSPDG